MRHHTFNILTAKRRLQLATLMMAHNDSKQYSGLNIQNVLIMQTLMMHANWCLVKSRERCACMKRPHHQHTSAEGPSYPRRDSCTAVRHSWNWQLVVRSSPVLPSMAGVWCAIMHVTLIRGHAEQLHLQRAGEGGGLSRGKAVCRGGVFITAGGGWWDTKASSDGECGPVSFCATMAHGCAFWVLGLAWANACLLCVPVSSVTAGEGCVAGVSNERPSPCDGASPVEVVMFFCRQNLWSKLTSNNAGSNANASGDIRFCLRY